MSDFPTRQQIINAMAAGIARTQTRHNDHEYLPDAKQLADIAWWEALQMLPRCETPDSAAYCYEKLEGMRDEQKE